MKHYKPLQENIDIEKVKDIIFSITSGTGLTDKLGISQQDKNIIKEWAKTQPKVKGLIYRLIWVKLEDYYDKHIYKAHQSSVAKDEKLKQFLSTIEDEPIQVKEFEAWTRNKHRAYGYGNPSHNQDTVLLIVDSSKIPCVDISEYSKYPVEEEIRNLKPIQFVIDNATYTSAGWELKVSPK